MRLILKGKIKRKKSVKTVRLGNVKDIGVGNVNTFIKNFREIKKMIDFSKKSGFYIESTSLQLQLIDLWLRELVKEKTGKQFVFGERYDFGKIIEDSKPYLSDELYNQIKEFNKTRIKMIHYFIYGSISYEEIGNQLQKYNSLHSNTFKFVIKTISQQTKK